MNPMLRPVRYLNAVVEHANFTRAAEALHVSQSALSQQIMQLEASVGAQLLDRGGRVVRPTAAGEAYLDHAREALRQLDAGARAVRDLAGLARGRLLVASTPTLAPWLVGPLFDRFHARHPGVALRHVERPQDEIEAALADDAVDLALAFTPQHAWEVDAVEVARERLALTVGDGHPLAGRPPEGGASEGEAPGGEAPESEAVDAAGLAALPWALLAPRFLTRSRIDRHFAALGVTPTVAVEVDTVGALLSVVRGGRLATLLPASVVDGAAGVRILATVPPPPNHPVLLLSRRGAALSAAARAFIALARAGGPA